MKSLLKYTFKPISLCFKHIPLYSTSIIVLYMLNGIAPVLQAQLTANFIDNVLKSPKITHIPIVLILNILCIIAIVGYLRIFQTIQKAFFERAQLKMKENFTTQLIVKCSSLSYKYLEKPDVQDLIFRVTQSPEVRIIRAYNVILSTLSTIVSIVGIMYIIAARAWWSAVLIIGSCIPLFICATKSGKANYATEKETAFAERKAKYTSDILTERNFLHERETYEYSTQLNEEYTSLFESALKTKQAVMKKWLVRTKLGGSITSLAGILIVIVLSHPLMNGSISLGIYIALINAILSMTQQLSWGLSNNIDAIIRNGHFAEELDVLQHFSEDSSALLAPVNGLKIHSLEFRNVSFRYPETDNLILNNVSFHLDSGRSYALVGVNGAGKSTIVKLISGLYTEYTGEILINNINIRNIPAAQLKGAISVMPQNFIKHQITIRENCLLGNPVLPHEITDNKIMLALKQVDLWNTVNELPNKLDTSLGKIDRNGVDLSQGQWQRLAMARTMLGEHTVKILDEPTASLDPQREVYFYETYNQLTENELSLFISHRMGATKMVDEILVLNNGKIVEKGCFNDLLALNGLFAHMFRQQQRWYYEA